MFRVFQGDANSGCWRKEPSNIGKGLLVLKVFVDLILMELGVQWHNKNINLQPDPVDVSASGNQQWGIAHDNYAHCDIHVRICNLFQTWNSKRCFEKQNSFCGIHADVISFSGKWYDWLISCPYRHKCKKWKQVFFKPTLISVEALPWCCGAILY